MTKSKTHAGTKNRVFENLDYMTKPNYEFEVVKALVEQKETILGISFIETQNFDCSRSIEN